MRRTMHAPILIPVSELRRDVARLIEKARRTPDPLFITQRGYITAVLMAPARYEELRDAARPEPERIIIPRRPLNDRRTHSLLYGPQDWETARLTDAEDEEYDEDEEDEEDEE
jgi:prevent-host-death family protein